MKKGLIPGLTLVAAFAFAAAPAFAEENRNASTDTPEVGEGPNSSVIPFEEEPSHIFLTREENERALFREPLARRTANMTYHGGKILTQTVTTAIFWGTSWNSPGDKITGLDSWYGVSAAATTRGRRREYTGSNGSVGTASSYQGHIVDTSAASGGNKTSASSRRSVKS